MDNIITYKEAINAAVNYADLNEYEPRCLDVKQQKGLYELTVLTTFQRYDFYVDAVSGDIIGLNAEPVCPIQNTIA